MYPTRPGGDGRVATIMAKRGEYPAGAHSTCRFGIQPDTDFDRFQWSPAQLWEVVADVLIGQHDRHRLVRLRVLLQGAAVMIPRKGFVRRKIEAALIRLAIGILMGRNVTRSLAVSRRDNNDMWHMAESLQDIAKRISRGYP
jgi:hypothetical protein